MRRSGNALREWTARSVTCHTTWSRRTGEDKRASAGGI